jgi:PAS domain S-box-containing protein
MSKEIKKNSAKLNAILNTVVDGIITIDSKGIVESLNPSAAGLFGYSPDEVIGNNVSMLMPLPHRINHNQYLDNHLTKGVKNIIGKGREVEGKRKDGTTFPFWLNVEKVKIDDRIIFTGIIHDVSDLRKAEKDLLISEKQLSAIIDTAVDGIIMIDKKGVMEVVNPSAAQMFGYQWSELIGKNVRSLMPEPDHSAHDGYLNNYHQTGIRRIIGIGREVKGKRKDNTIFPFNLSISEVPLPDRTIYVGVIHDISYQKEAQSRIETLNEQLEKKVEERTEKLAEVVNKLLVTNKSLEKQMKATEAAQTALLKSQEELTIALAKEQELNQLKSRFVSTASHEFRTPLSTILSSAALIARYTAEGTEAKRQRHVDKIKSSVKHLNSILDDFLSIAKLEEGKFNHHPSIFNVKAFISDVIEEVSGILKLNQTVSVSCEGDAETCLNQQFFKNILINLISNASKYSDDSTNIEVHSENAQNELTIKVIDYGIGIPLTEQVHLFERFFRAQNAINIQGTGLGLNIVKKYVDLMDGNITFISKENEGTTFIVKLPFDS